MKKRIAYLDIARGIGILLVLLGHVPTTSASVRFFISSFHMPLFFLISGMLLFTTDFSNVEWKSLVIRKAKRLMLPYFFFSGVSLLLEAFFLLVFGRGSVQALIDQLVLTVTMYGNSVFWFLPALFFGECIFIFVWKKTKKRFLTMMGIGIFSYLCFLGEKVIYENMVEISWYFYIHLILLMLIRCLFAAVLITIGWYGHKLLIQWEITGRLQVIIAAVLLVTTFLISRITCGLDLNYMEFHFFTMDLVTAVSGSFAVILISMFLDFQGWKILAAILAYFGRNSLFIMITHIPFYVMYVAVKITEYIRDKIQINQICSSLVTLLLVIILEVIGINLWKVFFKFIKKNKSI